jgi:hypothetical protein
MQAPAAITGGDNAEAEHSAQEFLESPELRHWAATQAYWGHHLYLHLSGLSPVREPETECDAGQPKPKRCRDLLPQK